MVTKLDSSEPTWAGEDGAKVEQEEFIRRNIEPSNGILVTAEEALRIIQDEDMHIKAETKKVRAIE